MKKFYFLLIALFITSLSFGQTTFFAYSFEDNGNGTIYNTSVAEFSDGSYDFFTSTFNNPIGGSYGVTGQDGTHYFAGQDLDGETGPAMTTLTMDIDISGRTTLGLKLLIAEDDYLDPKWDDDDYVHIDYSIDGGTTQNFLWLESEAAGTNSETRVDTDFDGVGDGLAIPEAFTEFQGAITGTGTTLTLTFTFRLDSGNEDIAIDNIRVIENFVASPSILVGTGVSGLDYEVGSGPSAEGSFTVEGSNLTDDILLTAPTDFEISETSGSGFGSSVTLTQSGGNVSSTTIYARLKSSLAVNSYSGDVTASSTGATSQTVSLSGSVYNPTTNAMVITGVYDALNNSAPKGIELYVLANIPDLSVFGVGSANNGGGTDGQEFTFPSVGASLGDRIFIASESPEFTSFFGFAPDYVDGSMGINGDDAIELFENGQVIDVFGDINTDGSGEAWEYTDGWAYRNSTTGPDGSTFNISNWTFSGIGNLDGVSGNASSTSPYPGEQYNLSTKENQINGFDLYPNPTKEAFVTITSDKHSPMKVSVYDILGKQVLQQTVTNNRLNISNLNTGVYILRAEQDHAFTTRKLVIN